MKELDGVVKFYLKNETNNALLITGDWGVGKTYYYKNTLEKQISQTENYRVVNKKYKPILVSLFGLSTLEDVQTQIFLSIYPILQNKKVKIGMAVGKMLFKAILNFKDWGDYYEIVSETGINKKDLINFNNLVICFDDLERVSSTFQIEELIGFINSLTESNNVKILIIANENHLDKEKFIHLKEKVIGSTIEYIPDIKTIYDSLISNKFSEFSAYREFLSQKKEYIIENITSHTDNIRTLYFILTYYHSIYTNIILKAPTYKFVQENIENLFNLTLKFIIAVAIEHKKGALSYRKKTDLDNSTFDISDISLEKLSFNRFIQNKEAEIPKSYKEIFLEKYYGNENYLYLESIFNFITGGDTFDEALFLKELMTYYNVQNGTIPLHYEVYNKLQYPEVFKLNNKDYLQLTRQLLNFSDKGLYNLENYITIFYYIARFNNPLKFHSLDNLEKRIIKGIRKGKDKYKHIPSLQMFLHINSDSEFYKHLINIRDICIIINNEKKQILDDIESENLQKLYIEDWESFNNLLLNKEHISIFNSFDITKFYSFYINSETSIKWKINNLFKYRYREQAYNNYLTDELPFIEALQTKIHKKIKSIPNNGLYFFVYSDLNKTLFNTIESMKCLV